MADRVLTAEARISASDQTGSTFQRVAEKVKGLERQIKALKNSADFHVPLGQKLAAVGQRMQTIGRRLTIGAGIPAAIASGLAYHTLREFELSSNKLKAFGDLTDEQLKHARSVARALGKDYSYGPSGVLAGMVEQIKAGFEPRHLEAIQKPLLDFATVAELTVPRASELAIFALAGFGKMYDQTGKMLEAGLLSKNLREMIDLFAILNKVAPGSVADISETFKYAAASAKNLKISPEQLGAFTAVLAQSGIIGAEAGVALRSMIVRFLKPPRGALASMSAAGLKMDDYIIKNPALLKSESILSAIEQKTGTLTPQRRAQILSRLGKLQGAGGEEYEKGLIAAIRTGGGDLADADVAADLATRIMGTAIEKIDVMRFLKDVFGKVANPAAFLSLFMDQRQGNRLANLDANRIVTMLAAMDEEIAKGKAAGVPVSTQMSETIRGGLIGAENRLRGSWQNLLVAMGESGVIDSAARMMDGLASLMRTIADTNPKLLEFGTYATAAAVALGPLVVVLGNLVTVAGALAGVLGLGGAGTAAAAGGTAVATAGGSLAGAGAMAGLGLPGGLLGLGMGAYFSGLTGPRVAAGRQHRDYLAAMRRDLDEREDIAAGRWAKPEWTPPAWPGDKPVTAEVKGSADLKVGVEVTPSNDFITRIVQALRNEINMFTSNLGTMGSTGQVMPEAGANPQ